MTPNRFAHLPTSVNALVVDFDLTGKELLVVALLAQLGAISISEPSPETSQQADEIIQLLTQWSESEAMAEQALARLQAVLLSAKGMLRSGGLPS